MCASRSARSTMPTPSPPCSPSAVSSDGTAGPAQRRARFRAHAEQITVARTEGHSFVVRLRWAPRREAVVPGDCADRCCVPPKVTGPWSSSPAALAGLLRRAPIAARPRTHRSPRSARRRTRSVPVDAGVAHRPTVRPGRTRRRRHPARHRVWRRPTRHRRGKGGGLSSDRGRTRRRTGRRVPVKLRRPSASTISCRSCTATPATPICPR